MYESEKLVKNPRAMWETWVESLDWEDALEKGKATHSSILPQDPSPLRGTLGSSLRSPAEGEGHEGFPGVQMRKLSPES